MATPSKRQQQQQEDGGDEAVPVRVADHLEQDAPIRGQRFACVSFVSPEEALASKDAFIVQRFLASLGSDVKALLSDIETAFSGSTAVQHTVGMLRDRHTHLWDERSMQTELQLYRAQNAEQLDEQFRAEHGRFRTSVRGFKLRGSYDTLEQAQERAHALRRMDDRFDVFVAEVGCWCPWSPGVEQLDAEYAETQLNTLVKKYKDGMQAQEEVYNQRRSEMIGRMSNERDEWVQRMKEQSLKLDGPIAEDAAGEAEAAAQTASDATGQAQTGQAQTEPAEPEPAEPAEEARQEEPAQQENQEQEA